MKASYGESLANHTSLESCGNCSNEERPVKEKFCMTGMSGSRKSDNNIVPEKPANNQVKTSAEQVEGRALGELGSPFNGRPRFSPILPISLRFEVSNSRPLTFGQFDQFCAILDNVPHLSYIYRNLNGGNPWAKHPQSELELNPI